jgi:hypothetical protein
VAVALSVDGLNTIDARQTGAWDASKWLIRPYESITVRGWQVGTERARRFYFTNERDSYAAQLGRVADFGRITAIYFRERRPLARFGARAGEPAAAHGQAAGAAEGLAAAPEANGSRLENRGLERRPWREEYRAATGMGRSEQNEISVVAMDLEPRPVAEVEIQYRYHYVWRRPEPLPLRAPAAGATFRKGAAAGTDEHRFCPEP